ncbi:MAG: neutral/alkaline non-lysosomal ceramidase N-terminal domain-containing protein [FCB group bacterium]|jgi:hypothetical protein|nr:neutral/alkaline non-lysosomal ceramidase N-terminal domain-containing protein [FCB group bacterium]
MRSTCLLILGGLFVSLNAAWGLDAGTGVADITPDVKAYKVPMAGYGARDNKPATGVHDPLHAKVLFLRDGDVQVALITCDLRSITAEYKNQVVAKTASLGFTADNVFMAASHTHDGPSMYPEEFWQFQFGAYDPKIVDIMSTSTADALKRAVENAAPAKVGFGEGSIEGFVRNRRWGYDTAAREAAGEKPALDPVAWVMRVDGMDGRPRVVLANIAAHPTILGAENMRISAEWPGVLQNELEKAFPGAVAMFTNGAEGDMAPETGKFDDDFEKMNDFGVRISKIVEEVAGKIETKPGLPIAIKRATPDLPEFDLAEFLKTYPTAPRDVVEAGLPRKAELQILRIGSVALVGLPGEPLLDVGLAVRKSVTEEGFSRAVVVGLANDYIGYLVPAKEFPHGGYEVDTRSYYGTGLGDFLAGQTRKIAREMK